MSVDDTKTSTNDATNDAVREKTETFPENEIDGSYFITSSLEPAKKRRLPPLLDHFNAKDLKNLLKCSLAVWVMIIFIFIDKTLSVIGQATFFGCIVLFILPPSGIVLIHLLASFTICFGMLLGWAWGVISMKAALATRSQDELNARYAELQQSMPQNTTNADQASGQSNYMQVSIFNGFMLDTRVSVTYFCMIGLFVYLTARLRVAAPKLTLVSMFAIIVSNIYLTIAPLIPTFSGTIPKVLILPVAIATGVGTVCNILIFPQSTSSITLDAMKDVLAPMPGFIKSLGWYLGNSESEFDINRLLQLRANVARVHKSLDASVTFLPMDFSYIKWSPQSIQKLQEPLRKLVVAFDELVQVPTTRERAKAKNRALGKAAEDLSSDNTSSGTENPSVAYHQMAKAIELFTYSRHPETGKRMNETLSILGVCASPLFQAWLPAFEAFEQAIGQKRSGDSETALARCKESLETLNKTRLEFEAAVPLELMKLHPNLFDDDGNVHPSTIKEHRFPLAAFLFGLLWQQRIQNFSDAVAALLQEIHAIETKQQKPRIWLPAGIQNIFSWAVSDDEAPSGDMTLARTPTVVSVAKEPKRRRRAAKKEMPVAEDDNSAAALLENMRLHRGRQRTKASNILLSVINWLTNDEGLLGLRMLVVTIALAIPAVIPSSAGFYYREKGLWALIMAQMAIVPYASEFVSGMIVRVLGTVLGGVLGMVVWYMGSGLGSGSPYGLAAILAVVIVALMWWRLFAPPELMMAGVMLVATLLMVVSYSWVDSHIPSYGNPGVGYNVFWRRILLVVIGFAAASLVTFFPRPVSGNLHCRQVLAEQFSAFRDRYALFVSTCRSPPNDLVDVAEKEAVQSNEVLTSLLQPIALTRFEFSTSNIDTATLKQICELCMDLNTYLTQLIYSTEKLDAQERDHFLRFTGAGSESFVADSMVILTIIQQSILSGAPLPAVLPTPLISRSNLFRPKNQSADGATTLFTAGSTRDMLTAEGGRQLAGATGAFLPFLAAVDELVVTVKKAVGEGSGIDLGNLDLESYIE